MTTPEIKPDVESRLARIEQLLGCAPAPAPNVPALTDAAKIARIKLAICRRFNLSLETLNSPRRPEHIAWPRQIAMHLSRAHTGASLQFIATQFRKRDHGAVMWACKTVHARYDTDATARALIDSLHSELTDSLTH